MSKVPHMTPDSTDSGPARQADARPEPIAIVGMSCVFPEAQSPSQLWELLLEGRDVIQEIPKDRYHVDEWYHPDRAARGKMNIRYGGFIDGVKNFDPYFFAMSPREAEHVDPQQRLMLRLAWEAMEDAHIVPGSVRERDVPVFIGAGWIDYLHVAREYPDEFGPHSVVGIDGCSISGRISYFLGLRGPSLTLNTGCSSALVAVHLACKSLWSNEASVALAGGVHLMFSPLTTLATNKFGGLSPDGRCKAFDARANGFVRSEGAGLVVLKPLSQALRDGNPVYCVIRSTAVNNDGPARSMVAPERRGQELVLEQAYERAGVDPTEVHYVEAHGTGTAVGDPVEAGALGAVLGKGRPADRPLRVGSIKTNIGHTEMAAGLAGLIKTALALKQRTIPGNLHFQTPNPAIPFDELNIRVQAQTEPWPYPDQPGLAGVSSFGYSATNAHVVLEEFRDQSSGTAGRARRRAETPTRDDEGPILLAISSRSERSLKAMAGRYATFLQDTSEGTLEDVAFTAGARRTHHEHRLAIAGTGRTTLVAALQAFERGEAHPDVTSAQTDGQGQPRVVFVFPGQGSQWRGMGRELLQSEPVFAGALQRCEAVISRFADWSLLDMLRRDEPWLENERLDIVQPTLFAVEVALAALWRSWGIEPDVVVGHSMGEVAAAHVAGALSLEDAARIICRRSQAAIPLTGKGLMAVVELPQEDVARALRGYEDRVSIAVSNSPRSTVISGEPGAIEEILAALEAQQVFCRKVKVDFASHSPQVEPLRDVLLDGLAPVEPCAGSVPLYSTVLGKLVDGSECDAQYWFKNLRAPVQFGRAILALLDSGHGFFVEMSPHPILNPAVQSMLNDRRDLRGAAVGSLRREQPEKLSLLQSMGTLYASGVQPAWSKLFSPEARPVPLPAYAWDEQPYWYGRSGKTRQSSRASRAGGHPLLGPQLRSSAHSGTSFWETELSVDDISYLADHRVEESAIFPAAGYLESALAGLKELAPGSAVELRDVTLREALVLPEGSSRRVQMVAVEQNADSWRLSLSSRDSGDGAWTTHATGEGARLGAECEQAPVDIEALKSRLTRTLSSDEFYAKTDAIGLRYGPAFRAIQRCWYGDGEVLARVTPADAAGPVGAPYVLHPVLLDAALQGMVATLPDGESGPILPTAVGRLRIHAAVPGSVWGHTRLRAAAGALSADTRIYDDDGKLLVEVRDLELKRLAQTGGKRQQEPLLAQMWERLDRPADASVDISGRWLVLDEGQGSGAAVADALSRRGADVVSLPIDPRLAEASSNHQDPRAVLDAMFTECLARRFDEHNPCRGVVHLWQWSVDPAAGRSLDTIERTNCLGSLSTLSLVRALARGPGSEKPRLWLVTRGAHWVAAPDSIVAPEQAAIWGFARTLRYEHPDLDCRLVDLPAELGDRADLEELVAEIAAQPPDEEVAIRCGERYVARLARAGDMELPEITAPAGERSYGALTERPGVLDAITMRATSRPPPEPGQVEIEVEAAGLNFRDVLFALGAIATGRPGATVRLGSECSGRITRLGPGVEGLSVGQPVVALCERGFSTHVVAGADLVFPRPDSLSDVDAAGLPTAHLTAYYALAHLARLAEGERVLIHSAAGGVGLAAIQWARHVGAEIFATAGTEEKRAYLRSVGVQRVSDSRSLRFADDVRRWTNGEGVDVVLNSLAGDFIPKSLDLLRSYGRFIEIGKRDYQANSLLGLKPFLRNLSFSLLDLQAMMSDRRPAVRKALAEVLAYVEQGVFTPLPTRPMPVAQIKDAFRCMAQAQHMGKLVIEMKDARLRIAPPTPTARVRADASYLVTGGLGGLGLAAARWLVARGARTIALVGRRDVQTEAQRQAIEELTAMGARVHVLKADVADTASIEALLRELDAVAPPLRGVMHAAGILDDATIEQQDAAKFARVMGPKVRGAWNLHLATAGRPLDFFVLYSSAAALVGSPGQANYAAANAFMDALAQHRHTLGLPALSINWGVFSDVGLAAAQENRGARLSDRGMGALTSQEGTELLERLMTLGPAQIGAVPLDMGKWLESHPQVSGNMRFAPLVKAAGADARNPSSMSLVEAVRSAPADERQEMLEHFVREQVVQVLRLDLSRAESHVPFKSLGLDSLTSLELRNRLERGTSLTLTATATWTYPTISELAGHLLDLLSTDDFSEDAKEEQPLVPRSPDELIPLTPGQERLWHASHTPGGNAAYSAVVGLDLLGELDVPALEWTFGEIIRRHSVLRSRVHREVSASQPEALRMVIDAWAPFQLAVQSVADLGEGAWQGEVDEEVRKEAERPFDLEREHPFRARLVRIREDLHNLIIKWHFIATGGTLAIFLNELVELYNARKQDRRPDLPALPIEFADYACWHKRVLDSGAHDGQIQERLKSLRGASKQLVFPRDSSPDVVAQQRGRSFVTQYPRELIAALHRFADERDVTMFMTLLAGFCALVQRQSGKQDIIIGSPLADKHRPELEHLLGMFVNTLVLRVDAGGRPTFDELVGRAKQVCLEAFSNSDVPFEIVQKRLEESDGWGQAAGMPLVQVTLAMMQGHDLVTSLPLDALQVVGMRRHCAGSKFELSIIFAETEHGLMAEVEYNPDSFSDQAIEALCRQFGSFLQQALALPGVPIDELGDAQ